MVIFNDTEKKERTRTQKWLKRGFITLAVLGILFGISLAVMGAIGGPHEALKMGVEDYLTEATGLETEIGEFDGLYFYPVVRLEGSNVRMAGQDDREAVSIARFEYRADFWDIFFSRLKAKHLKIEELKIRPGVILPLGLDIQSASFRPQSTDEKAGLVIDGSYGGHDLDFFWELGYENPAGTEGGGTYSILDDSAQLQASLEKFQIQGTAGLKSGGGLKVNAEKFGTDERHVSASFMLKRGLGSYSAELEMDSGGTSLAVDLSIDEDKMTGDIVFGKLTLEDIDNENGVLAIFTGFAELIGFGQGQDEESAMALPAMDIDLDIEAEHIYWQDERQGDLSFPLSVSNSTLKVPRFKGAIKGGKPKGSITLNTRKTLSTFDMDFEIKDLKYGVQTLSGHADLALDITSEGETLSALKSNIGGSLAFIGGEGEIDSRALDFWGGGVLNTMLPNLGGELRTKMNCFVANFEIEQGVAKTSPLFLDTGKLTVIGDGTIDLNAKTVNLSLEPQSKDITLIDIAVPVRVSGDLTNPSIRPSTLGIGKKLGGLLLGTINPAFFALNLANLGLTDNHPCKEFIGEAVSAPEDGKASEKAQDDDASAAAPVATEKPQDEGASEPEPGFELQTERSVNP